MLSGVDIYCEKAEYALKEKNLEDFLRYLGNAETVASDTETLARVLYDRATGLYLLRRFESSLKAIQEALSYPQSEAKYIRLLKAKANTFTYLGKFRDSLRIYKEVMTETNDEYLLSEIYLSMAWSYLLFYKSNNEESILDEAKFYIDEAYKSIENFDNNSKKRIVYRNYSEYFKLKKDYDLAIEMLEESLKYCADEKLCKAYNDLAELYLEKNGEEDIEIVHKYLHESETMASKYDNDFDLAKALFIKARLDIKAGDFIKAMDCLHTACISFLDIGAYNNAFDCYKELVRVSGLLNDDFVTSVKDKIGRQFEDTGYKELL